MVAKPHDFLEEKPQVVSTHHHYIGKYLRTLPWIYSNGNWGAHFGGPSNHEKQEIDGVHSDASRAHQPGHICFHKVGNVRYNLLSLTMLACSVPPGHIEVARLSKILFFHCRAYLHHCHFFQWYRFCSLHLYL